MPTGNNGWLPRGNFSIGYPCNRGPITASQLSFYRTGRYDEAEKYIRKAIATADNIQYWPLLASSLHQQGKIAAARKILEQTEARHAQMVKDALASPKFRAIQSGLDELWYQAMLQEARRLIHGKDPGPSADEIALLKRTRVHFAELEHAKDAYSWLASEYHDQPRLWIYQGRRLAEQGHWDEANEAFAKAIQLKPKEPAVWLQRGRTYAELKKWEEAAADFVKGLELSPKSASGWTSNSVSQYQYLVRQEDVFSRVVKARPKDRQLWIERVHFLARSARWSEALDGALRVKDLESYAPRQLALFDDPSSGGR